MAVQEKMSLLEFQKRFGTEEACEQHLFQMRWGNGYVCPKCGHTEYFNIKSRHLYQCKQCNHQASVTAGTVMERTRVSLVKWFWAMFLMSEDKRSCSALQLSSKLGVAYGTAWLLSHKIRKAMGDRDNSYILEGTIELDDAFFGATREGSKRGRGTEKTAVLVGVSLNEKGKPQFVKMQIIGNLKSVTLAQFAKKNIAAGSFISSDAYSSYNKLCEEGFVHESKKFNIKEDPDHLKWLHVIVSNVKSFINGTYHGLDDKHLQSYLDEFSWRFNRRYFKSQLFNRIVNSCVSSSKFTYYELTR